MTIAVRTCFLSLIASGVMSCQSRPLLDFPIGTFTSCAQGAHNPSGNAFMNAAGFQVGARLTLTQSGATVTSQYVDQNGLTQSLSFSKQTPTLATIGRKGQVIPGFSSLCVVGPGNTTRYPASMTVTAGALTYNSGTVFLTLTGDLRSNAGACGTLSQSNASFWLACEDRQGGSVRSVDAAKAPAAQLPAGQYSCSTQVETLGHMDGQNQYVTGGATGTLTLTKDGAKVITQYSGDAALTGTLRFTATTPTTASAEAGQNLMAPCTIPKGTGQLGQKPELAPIAAGSLTMIDSTLFLSFAGTMAERSSCPGAQVAGSLICSR